MVSLEELVRRHVHLGRKNAKGWEECLHSCDHGRKGNRAAFLFENTQTAFHCFNCGVSTVYDSATHTQMPSPMAQVLTDFNISQDDLNEILFASMQARDMGVGGSPKASKELKIEPPELVLPETFYPLAGADDSWAEIAKDYLINSRQIDPSSYPFMLSKRTKDVRFVKWYGRIIIPIYKSKKLIYFQGRDLTGTKTKKYESPAESKDCVMHGFDLLFDRTASGPLYVVEGWFDAHHLNCVALLGNELTAPQIAWLNKSPREKVYIPDRFGDGKRNARKALKLGWSVSVPYETSWDPKIKDISDSIAKYGKLFTLKQIIDHTGKDDISLRLEMVCK